MSCNGCDTLSKGVDSNRAGYCAECLSDSLSKTYGLSQDDASRIAEEYAETLFEESGEVLSSNTVAAIVSALVSVK